MTAYESGGTAGVFRLEQRVPASLAASIDAVINGSLINGSLIRYDGPPLRGSARGSDAPFTRDGMRGVGRVRGGARRRASLALAELEAIAAATGIELDLDDGDDDEGGGAVSAGGTLRAALLLRERDAGAVNAESWRSAAAKCVESVRSPASASSSFEVLLVVRGRARRRGRPARRRGGGRREVPLERRSFRRGFREQVEAARHPRDGQAVGPCRVGRRDVVRPRR